MSRECSAFLEGLDGGLESHGSHPHIEACGSCAELYESLRGVEALTRASRQSVLADGFAAKVARVALASRAEERADSLTDRLIRIAIPTAAASVVCAVAVLFALGWTSRSRDESPIEDPVAVAVELPESLGDPTLAVLGVRE